MKYFATLGPNFGSYEDIIKAKKLGLTGLRINLSHVDLSDCKAWLDNIRRADDLLKSSSEVLIDIQGAEIRIDIKEDFQVKKNDHILISSNFSKDLFRQIVIDERVFLQLELGDNLSIDDGKLKIEIIEKKADGFIGIAKEDALVSKGKSLSIVGKDIILPDISDKDLLNLSYAKDFGIKSFMLPFVRDSKVVNNFKKILEDLDIHSYRIYAKIEDKLGIDNLDEIIQVADEIVIARGDLANNISILKIGRLQKEIVAKCIKFQADFMVVTDLLSSMINNPSPTRAEINDIYNSTLDGAVSLMLTGETAIGKYPLEAIDYLIKASQV